MARLDHADATAADGGGHQGSAAAGEPGAAAAPGVRGSPLDRQRHAGAARQPGREPARGTRCSCSSTTAPSTSTAGAARRTTAQLRLDPAARRRRPRGCSTPSWAGSRPRAAQAAPDRPDPGKPVLPGGDASGAWSRAAPSPATPGRLPPGQRRCRPSRSRPRCRPSSPRGSTASRPRTSACCSSPRSSARTCRCRCSGRSPTCPRRISGAAWPVSRPPSSSTRPACSPTPSTRSGTP